MSAARERWPAALALLASLLGLIFGGESSLDYIQHLDRQVHDVHCSFVPGMAAEQGADSACRVAMYSPYAALFRDRFWGGVPIALFALGAFGFFAAFALYVLLAGRLAPRKALLFLATFGVTPLLVSILMATITALRLGHFCKVCVGIYVSSALLAVAGIAGLVVGDRVSPARSGPPAGSRPIPTTLVDDASRTVRDPETFEQKWGAPRPPGGFALIPAWTLGLGLFTAVPALLYVSALPSYTSYINGCGKLEKAPDAASGVVHVTFAGASQPATILVDPLCPSCKALHQRLTSEGLLDKLDLTLVLFPLDSECNWMLDRAVHPGSCVVSKAILCSEHRALPVLEWAYERQDDILEAAKAGAGVVNVRAMIRDRFPGLDACIDAKETKLRLDHILRYVVQNHLPVSTPQMFLGETRLCDEDSDMGLSYTIRRLAPGLRGK
jgi:uncharacterized membrane protein